MADPARVHQLLDELQAERERAARIRAATTLVVLGMFLIFATNTWVGIQRFDGEALMVNLEKQAEFATGARLPSDGFRYTVRGQVPARLFAHASPHNQFVPNASPPIPLRIPLRRG